MTIDVPTEKVAVDKMAQMGDRAKIKKMVSDGVADLKLELVSLRNELVKLNRVVMPLTAIVDLSLTFAPHGSMKAIQSGESLPPDTKVNIAELLSQEERERQLESLNA